ncbi:sugar-binding protein [Lutibacter sp. B1]|uniref:sugar-binding protein n=1 Tax=Lutibacter sp. B1 TaxID=2725996 RepID=UPI0014563BF9|nr:sugar-binding protein [Lutibacter sp. B1]NLP58314.1 hypothetical protein [Lutibacter sp. B1]
MKPLYLTLLLSLFIHQYFLGQNEQTIFIDIPSQQKPWNTLDWNDSPSQFQFAIVTDRTGGHRPGIFMDAIRKLNLLQPEFVMSVGDLIEGYTTDVKRLDSEWTEFNSFIDSLQTPFFYVPGNHDITNKVMEKKWQELFGVTYYHFVYKDVLFLCLNSEDNYRGAGKGTIDDEQYEYIKKALEDNKNVKWTLVFLHQPLWVQEDTKRWLEVEKLLEDRNHNVFAGHYHRYWKTERNNGKYIALATTGGGSKLRGTAYGEFDHVVWVTMTEKGPILTNLLLNGIWDENIVTKEIVDLVRNRPFPVQIEPVYIENKKTEQLSTSLRITNTTDYKMSVKIHTYTHPSVFYKLDTSEIIVEPNDVSKLTLSLINKEGIDLTKMAPIHIEAEVKYDYEGRTDLVLKNTINFMPFPKLMVKKIKKDIVLDGNLNEWGNNWITIDNFKGIPFDYKGPNDCSVKFSTTYDETNLYLALNIQDDELYINEGISPWQQDALIVGLDARPKHISAVNVGESRGKDWLLYFRSFKDENALYGEEFLPKGVKSAIKKSKNGVTLEIAFPIEYLNKMQMNSWSDLRLGVGYYDFDDNGEKRTEHFWYPSWDSNENISGSGMLFKE